MATTIPELNNEIIDIERTLGTNPEGIYSDVRVRFDILEARINNPNVASPTVTNPVYLDGYGGISLSIGDAIPTEDRVEGSIYIQRDGYMYIRRDGYWNIFSDTGAVPILEHNLLLNIQGGSGIDGYYHLTNSEHSWLLDGYNDGYWNQSKGGTNQTSYSAGDILYANGSGNLSKLTIGTDGYYLSISSGLPIWSEINGLPDGLMDGYYNKTEVNQILVDGYYSKDQTNQILADGYYSKIQTNQILADGYYNKIQTNQILTDGYYSKTEMNAILDGYSGGSIPEGLMDGYYNKTEVNQILVDGYYSKIEMNAILDGYSGGSIPEGLMDGYYNKIEVNQILVDGYYSKTEMNIILDGYSGGSIPEGLMDGYYNKAQTNLILSDGYYNKTEIDTILSELTSSGGYLNSFDNDDLVAGILTVNHNIGHKYIICQIYDGYNEVIVPDSITAIDDNTLEIDLNTYSPLYGTYNIIVSSGAQPISGLDGYYNKTEVNQILVDGYYSKTEMNTILDGYSGGSLPPGILDGYVKRTQTAIDGYTLHCWYMNDASSQFTDTGTAANASLTNIVNASNVYFGNIGVFSDCVYFENNGYALSAVDVGIPTSNTKLSIHGWVKIRNWGTTSAYSRLFSKGYNLNAATTPYESIAIVLRNTGAIYTQWASSGLKATSEATGRGIIKSDLWYHIAVTFDQASTSAVVKLYVNGSLINSQTVTSGAIDWNAGSSGEWSVGGRYAAGAAALIDGWVNDWRIDDGIIRDVSYFKEIYKNGMLFIY